MSTGLAATLAMFLSFVALVVFALTEVLPFLRRLPVRRSLALLVWVHAARHVALQLFSSQSNGFAVSDSVRDQIVYGDLAGMVLSLVCLIALHRRWSVAPGALWLFVGATVVDLANALRGGLAESLLAAATDVSWVILTFYVPLLWATVILAAITLYRAPDGWLSTDCALEDT